MRSLMGHRGMLLDASVIGAPFLAVSTTSGEYMKIYRVAGWGEVSIVGTGATNVNFFTFSDDGQFMLAGGNSNPIKKYSTINMTGAATTIAPAGTEFDAHYFKSDTEIITASGTSPYVARYNASTEALIASYSTLRHPDKLSFSPDKSKFVMVKGTTTGSTDLSYIFNDDMTPIVSGPTINATPCDVAAWSPDGTMLAFKKLNDSALQIYNTSTWALITTITVYAFGTTGFAWRDNGLFILEARAQQTLVQINPADWSQTTVLTITSDQPTVMAVNQDGTLLALQRPNTGGKGLTVYNMSTWGAVLELSLSTLSSGGLSFSV